MAGTLRLFGEGKLPPEEMKNILGARDRTKAGPMAPACGLYFMRVDYAGGDFIKGVDSLL
jgi:tRNA pseudouridine38-40 synthase